ncbi:hypothetical protein [Marivirga arenosa]|uniref:YD repeat-containing protein n=1 Tax=Marivirga arenosa TaxID=3059076 RepID=A0AA51ZV15_9BACT|nr:hypothetical protein [Marivirga sp. BKB1-2]WNB17022.1 hypothetical protein QYS47_32640 [Marivirga sp. BKB1-2]
MKFLLTLFSLILAFNILLAQEDSFSPKTPVVPETYAFAKYDNIPVNYSTGVPNISIPIYSSQAKGSPFSVSLRYHAGGIKVQERASRVGLGWSLDFARSITREVRGLVDETNNGWFNGNFNAEAYIQLSEDDKRATLFDIINGLVDSQPDIFNYSTNNGSGKFYYSEYDVVTFMPHSKIKVEKVESEQNAFGFIITDVDGTKYYYGISADKTREAIDNSVSRSYCYATGSSGSGFPNTSTPILNNWHLMTIIDANGINKTSFFYEPILGFDNCNVGSETKIIGPAGQKGTICFSTSTTTTYRIKTIESSIEKVNFHYEFDRVDIAGDQALSKIEIKDKGDNLLKSYLLNYDYFQSTNLQDEIWQCDQYLTVEERLKRLKLTSIREVSPSGLEKPDYQFKYNTKINLPDILSFSKDHWGYYNGTDNTTSVPEFQLTQTLVYAGADRTPSEDYTKANILEEVTYPTGGKINFKYELNRVLSSSQSTLENIEHIVALSGNSIDQLQTKVLEIDHEQNIPIYFTGVPCLYDEDGNPRIDCFIRAKIVGVDNDTDVDITHLNSIYLTEGNYKIEVEISGDPANENYRNFSLATTIKKRVDATGGEGFYLHGGLRTKAIEYKDASLGINRTEYFEYLNGYATGSLIYEYPYRAIGDAWAWGKARTSSSNVSISNNGTAITYQYVSSRNALDSANGYTLYEYDVEHITNSNRIANAEDAAANYFEFPFPPLPSNIWQGKLLSKSVFEKLNSDYKLKSEEFNFYEEEKFNQFNNKAVVARSNGDMDKDRNYPGHSDYEVYTLNSAKLFLKSKKIFNYDIGGESTELTEEYTYDLNGNLALDSKTVSYNNETYLKEYQYAEDNFGVSANNEMIDRNMIQQPLKIINYRNGVKTNSIEKSYSIKNNIIYPQKKRITNFNESSEAFSEEIYDIDQNGNINYVIGTDGIEKSVIYGYNNQLIIAEVTGAKPEEIFYTSFEDDPSAVIGESKSGHKYLPANSFNLPSLTNSENPLLLSYWAYVNNNWQYVERDYTGTGDFINESNASRLDEVRIYPKKAQMRTFIHKPLVSINQVLDVNQKSTSYEFDPLNRLKSIYDDDKNILKLLDYNYKLK